MEMVMAVEQPAYLFVTRDGEHHRERPRGGIPYKVLILNRERYDAAVRDGSFYLNLGGELIDNLKTS
jgi:hypothetical protein